MYWKQTLLSASLAVSVWAQAPAPDPATKVVATIAGQDVTAADIQKMLAAFSPQDVQVFQQNPQNVLSQYFLFVHLADEADKAKLLEKSPYKEQYMGLRLQLLRNARLNEENNTFPVTSEMIESYYKQHGAQYEQAKIKAIYLPYAGQVVPSGTDKAAIEAAAKQAVLGAQSKRPEADTRKLADDIVKQLRGGADFAKLVEQYSEDATSKAAGGDFGVIKAVSQFPGDFKSAIFALKPGEIGDPIRQPTAFYIVRLEEKGSQPLEEVHEPIVQALRNDHMNQWMKDLNTSYQAVIKDPDYFQAIAPPALPGGLPTGPAATGPGNVVSPKK